MKVYDEKVGVILQKVNKELNSDIDEFEQVFSASRAVAAARQNKSKKAGSLLIIAGVVIALLTVLFVPMFTGGASSPTTSDEQQEDIVVELKSTNNAQPVLGYEPILPGKEPNGYTVEKIKVINGVMLEIEYVNGKNTIIYRTARGNEDLSGVETEYLYSATTSNVEGANRSYAGPSENKLNLAVWANNGNSFAIVSKDAIGSDLMKEFAESIQ